MLTTTDTAYHASFRPGASVVLAASPTSPIMTVLRERCWGHRAWYIVAWLDPQSHRCEACLAADQLRPAEAALAS